MLPPARIRIKQCRTRSSPTSALLVSRSSRQSSIEFHHVSDVSYRFCRIRRQSRYNSRHSLVVSFPLVIISLSRPFVLSLTSCNLSSFSLLPIRPLPNSTAIISLIYLVLTIRKTLAAGQTLWIGRQIRQPQGVPPILRRSAGLIAHFGCNRIIPLLQSVPSLPDFHHHHVHQ